MGAAIVKAHADGLRSGEKLIGVGFSKMEFTGQPAIVGKSPPPHFIVARLRSTVCLCVTVWTRLRPVPHEPDQPDRADHEAVSLASPVRFVGFRETLLFSQTYGRP
jgi:hypothetical protein